MGLIKGYKGFYYYRYVKPDTGRFTNISTGTMNIDEAMRFVEDFKANPQNRILTKNNVTIQDLKKEILIFRQPALSSTSLYLYEKVLENLEKIIGNKFVKFIDVKDIEIYRAKRLNSEKHWKKFNQNDNKVSRATVNTELTYLRAIFNIAKNFGYIYENPANKVTKLKVKAKQRKNLTKEEVKKIIDYFTGTKDSLMLEIFRFAIYTGCRINEIVHVQWEDIDLENNIINIVNKGNFTTKNFENRKFHIHIDLLRIIKEKEKSFLIEGYDKSLYNPKYFFSKDNGERYCKSFISHKFKNALRNLGLPEYLHFHSCRFTCIGFMNDEGCKPAQIQKAIGHKSLETTLYYINSIDTDTFNTINSIPTL